MYVFMYAYTYVYVFMYVGWLCIIYAFIYAYVYCNKRQLIKQRSKLLIMYLMKRSLAYYIKAFRCLIKRKEIP